ncbi:Gfo/Idh/MocA family protein [Portibacter lacus]|uniref:Oxidoreductase n=1 Tax=Portibacter lacus TaxID=1099794 RepID=A0AA37WDX1_9BACT|nr:Gfo/Idh/MocA family oxidoreductase [Portibacter lacus]GLR15570.1 putative oxidoreductase [Portibacter lacus]
MKKIKWGIIGLGGIARKFAKDLNETEGCEIRAVASRSQVKADEFAATFNAQKAFGSYEDLMQDKEIDIIYIATPHSHHYENTMMCLEAGFNVLCEKAFAINREQAVIMIEKAREKNLFLMEGLWSRFNPAILGAFNDVKNGLIGNLCGVKADFCFHFPYDADKRLCNKNLGGGSLLDIGIYPIFLSYLFLGKPIRMNAEAEYFPNGTDKNLVMLFDYENGEEAILNSSLQYFSPCDAYIYGDEGCIRIHGRWHEANAYTRFKKNMDEPITKGFGTRPFSFKYEIDEVVACLKEGRKESAKWSLQNSLDLMEVLDSVRKDIHLNYGAIEETKLS